MSQMEIDRVLAQIRTLSAQVRPPAADPAAVAGALQTTGRSGEAGGVSFGAVLRQGIEQVNATQSRSSELAAAFERGAPGVELPQVMLEMQKASVSFRAVTEVRNRLVDAYREIMNMPI